MTSINFNASATTALRTLQSTNSALETTQNRVSTGLKIGEAKDNAAYWSISTTLKSDNTALSTVKDALTLGAATVDTAYQGLNAAINVVNEIKSKVVAATQDGVDKVAVQAEITALQEQLKSISSSSTFSGENWLSVNSDTATSANVVSSYTRDGDAVTIGTIPITFAGISLMDAGAADGALEVSRTGSMTGFVSAAQVGIAAARTITDEVFRFTVAFGSAGSTNIVIDKASVQSALNIDSASDAIISTNEAMVKVINAAFATAKVTGIAAEVIPTGLANAGEIRYVSDKSFTLGSAAEDAAGSGTVLVGDVGLIAAGAAITSTTSTNVAASLLTIDVTGKTTAQLKGFSEIVNKTLNVMTAAAASLGAVSKRLDLQNTFVQTIIDTIEKGVSGLIDADLSEESTRLQALQTKQQLGIQALSIANSSQQNVLRLFQ